MSKSKAVILPMSAILLAAFTFVPQPASAGPDDNGSKGTVEALKKRNEFKKKRRMEATTSGTAVKADKETSGTKM